MCPCDVEEYGGSVYQFCTTGASWEEAEANCQSDGYGFVTIDDEAENTFVIDTADAYSSGQWWIGLNDRTTEGIYQ